MTKIYSAVRAILILLLLHSAVKAQIGYTTIVATGLDNPIDIAIPPNASPTNGSTRIFVAQQNGLIRLWNGSSFSDFLNINSIITTGGERGLLSMTFHPSYNGTSNRDFFVYYTDLGGDLVVARYRTQVGNPDAVEGGSATLIINPIEHSARTNHNGGDLNFGPDGYLYLTTGDGGGAGDPDENAQNASSFLGKLLRIDVAAGTLPTTPTVIDIGLRNPFRWSFDRATGNAWIGDVGQGAWEEINFKPAGSTGLNFGWDCYEGNAVYEPAGCPPSGFTAPSYTYPNPASGQSVVGGYVYRGTEFTALQGWYIATDYYSGRIFRRSPGGVWYEQTGGQAGISSFGEAPDGTLYAVSQFSDDLYKVIVTGPLPVVLSSFSGTRSDDVSDLKWKTTTEQNTARFKIEYGTTPGHFQTAGTVIASRNAGGNTYSFQHRITSTNDLYYRLAIEDDDGRVAYSSIIRLSSARGGIKVYPTIIRDGLLNIQSEKPVSRLQILNASGAVVFQKGLDGFVGTTAVSIPKLAKGMYVVQVYLSNEIKTQKIVVE